MIDRELADGVGLWLTVPDIVERFGLTVRAVRRMVDERDVLALRIPPDGVLAVPSRFFDDHGPLPALKGTVSVLGDSGLADEEVVAWLFRPDASWGDARSPIEALHTGRKTEVRRRAMEAAW